MQHPTEDSDDRDEQSHGHSTESKRRRLSAGGIAILLLLLLPLSALATHGVMDLDRFTAESVAELESAQFGWPLDWVEQDLSGQPVETFPVTVGYTTVPRWVEPIETSFDWVMFGMNTLILGVGVTAGFLAVVFGVNRVLHLRRAERSPAEVRSGRADEQNPPRP